MSYNQSTRSDRNETQYRRTGRSTGGYHHQHHRSSTGQIPGAETPPPPNASVDSSSLSSNRSIAQGGESRVNLPPVNHSHHVPNVQSRSQVDRFYHPTSQVVTAAEDEGAKQRRLNGILNKLTSQNIRKMCSLVKVVNIDNAVTLAGFVYRIHDKALMETTLSEVYASFCFHLSAFFPDFNENGKEITFKRLLLNTCQQEFERREEEREEKTPRVGRRMLGFYQKKRMLGNIRFIGELYKKRMLSEKIIHACIQKLLGDDQDPHEENIEALCKLMSVIGVVIDHPKAKVLMDSYFEKMRKLSGKQEFSLTVRLMLISTIDLRRNEWQEKTERVISDTVHEGETQANSLSREPSITSSSGEGGMVPPRSG